MKRSEHLSYSTLLAAPGRLAPFIAGIVAWIFLWMGLFGAAGAATRGNALAMLVPGALALLPALAGPLLGGTPRSVEVGADGIATQWLWWRRFVPFADVAEIRVVEQSIEIRLHRGPSLWLRPVRRTEGRRRGIVAEDPHTSGLLRALRERLAAARAAASTEAGDEAEWARRQRPVATWVADILARSDETGDYRAAAVDRERLLQLAERPVADPGARAAAAVALKRLRIEPHERERLRIAADTTAHPRLRFALEGAGEDETDEAELVRRLTAVAD